MIVATSIKAAPAPEPKPAPKPHFWTAPIISETVIAYESVPWAFDSYVVAPVIADDYVVEHVHHYDTPHYDVIV